MRRILHDEIPDDNYFVLKYLVNFLTEVVPFFDLLINKELCWSFLGEILRTIENGCRLYNNIN